MGILTDDMQRVVREQRLGFIATVCADGTPNLSPKGTTMVWDADHLVFADLRSPHTMANLRHNPALEINVVDPVLRKGYRFKGRARILTEGSQYASILPVFGPRGVANAVRAIVLMKVERAMPLTSPAYDLGMSEDEVEQEWAEHINVLRRNRAKT